MHEEGAASPDWGDRMTPEIVTALERKETASGAGTGRGFLRPEYPTQVLVSYFEAGKICDYIVGKWGDDAILGMIHSYAARKTTAEAIEENLHEKPAAFDKEFTAWLDQQTGNTVSHFDQWKKGMKAAYADLQSGKQDDAIREGWRIRDYYPDYVGSDSDYELVAKAYLGSRATKRRRCRSWSDTATWAGQASTTLKKLARLEQEAGKPKQANATLEKLNYIYPEDQEIHRRLGSLLLDRGDVDGASPRISRRARPQAGRCGGIAFRPGQGARRGHQLDEAKDQVLMALEAAPDFKPAQQLLLQLSQ